MESINNPNAASAVNQTPVSENTTRPFLVTKNLRIALILIVLILITLAGGFLISSKFISKPKTISLTSKDLDTTVNIKKGDTILIESKTVPGLQLKTEISNPSIVEGSEAYDKKTGKFIGKFVGKGAGEVDVIVTGSYPCVKGEICLPLENLVSKNHIIISK